MIKRKFVGYKTAAAVGTPEQLLEQEDGGQLQ
jgi:hypothetical protein